MLVVALLVLWAACRDEPTEHDWTDDDGATTAIEVRHVQPYQAEKTYRCPGCDHEIRPGEGHEVVIPLDAPAGPPPLAHRLLARRAAAPKHAPRPALTARVRTRR